MISLDELVPDHIVDDQIRPGNAELAQNFLRKEGKTPQDSIEEGRSGEGERGLVADAPSTFKGWVRDPSWTGYPEVDPKHPFLAFYPLIRATYDAIELAYAGTGDKEARRRMREAVASEEVAEVEAAMGGLRDAYCSASKREWQKRLQAMKQYKEGCAWIKAFVIGQIRKVATT